MRDERANQTRLALLDAYEALLLEDSTEEVSIPAVARRAGVTKPTAYSYFPDQDALMGAFFERVRERIGMAHEALVRVAPADLPAAVRDNYRRFEENSAILRQLMSSPSYDRVRLARPVDRAGLALPTWSHADVPEAALRERLGAIYMLASPGSWRWLRDTWGLSPEAAARSAAWAIQTLVDSVGSTSKEHEHENSSLHDSGQKPRARRARAR